MRAINTPPETSVRITETASSRLLQLHRTGETRSRHDLNAVVHPLETGAEIRFQPLLAGGTRVTVAGPNDAVQRTLQDV